jgi:hypothetical protein
VVVGWVFNWTTRGGRERRDVSFSVLKSGSVPQLGRQAAAASSKVK